MRRWEDLGGEGRIYLGSGEIENDQLHYFLFWHNDMTWGLISGSKQACLVQFSPGALKVYRMRFCGLLILAKLVW